MEIRILPSRIVAVVGAAMLTLGGSEANAVTIVTNVASHVSNGGSISGTFSIAPVHGFRVASAALSAFGYSPINYDQAVGDYGDPVFAGAFNLGPTTINVYRRDRTITRVDSVIDEMRLTTQNTSLTVAVGTHFVGPQQVHNHNEMVNATTRIEYIDHIQNDFWYGPLAPSLMLPTSDLNSINATGALTWGVSAPVGQFGIGSVTLDYELEALAPPNPTPGPSITPEPSAWALLLLGFGGAGAALRRRRAPHPTL